MRYALGAFVAFALLVIVIGTASGGLATIHVEIIAAAVLVVTLALFVARRWRRA